MNAHWLVNVPMRGFNFPCANLLCDLISGLSVTIFFLGSGDVGGGKAFKSLVESNFFPWDATETAAGKEDTFPRG